MHSLIQLARARVACGKLAAAASDLDAVDQLLSAFSDAGRLPGMAAEVTHALEAARAGDSRLVEPPSPAELSVLRLLDSDMSAREIARETLPVAQHRTHARSPNLLQARGSHP